MKIRVQLAMCCQPFLFDQDGESVSYSHRLEKDVIIPWDNTGNVRVLDYPFSLSADKLTAHKELTAYLMVLGGLDAFFDLPGEEG